MDTNRGQDQQNMNHNNNNNQHHQHPPPQACPRCNSSNTKFCYYNNYSLSQPRYFCKGCRRYWTHGGTLRNVPVGGGSRKSNKRPKLDTSPSSSTATQPPPSLPESSAPATVVGGGAHYGGFLSSLAAIHAANQPINFGPNLGLLHGLGLPGLYAGSSSTSNWNLGNDQNDVVNGNNDIGRGDKKKDNANQWHDFQAGGGLDDP